LYSALNACRAWRFVELDVLGSKLAGAEKLIEDADSGVLVGATSAGPAGGEVLSPLTVAVHAQVPTATLRSMIYAYPTFHRAIESAVKDLA
jgi:pyruvate/2-oxoglutarate dehydrogenase complex dihydrolipoamide dehydrogenase (E3) component